MTTNTKIILGYSIHLRGFYGSNIPGDNLVHGNDAFAGGSTSCESLLINSLQ